jgi:hypothetical protein
MSVSFSARSVMLRCLSFQLLDYRKEGLAALCEVPLPPGGVVPSSAATATVPSSPVSASPLPSSPLLTSPLPTPASTRATTMPLPTLTATQRTDFALVCHPLMLSDTEYVDSTRKRFFTFGRSFRSELGNEAMVIMDAARALPANSHLARRPREGKFELKNRDADSLAEARDDLQATDPFGIDELVDAAPAPAAAASSSSSIATAPSPATGLSQSRLHSWLTVAEADTLHAAVPALYLDSVEIGRCVDRNPMKPPDQVPYLRLKQGEVRPAVVKPVTPSSAAAGKKRKRVAKNPTARKRAKGKTNVSLHALTVAQGTVAHANIMHTLTCTHLYVCLLCSPRLVFSLLLPSALSSVCSSLCVSPCVLSSLRSRRIHRYSRPCERHRSTLFFGATFSVRRRLRGVRPLQLPWSLTSHRSYGAVPDVSRRRGRSTWQRQRQRQHARSTNNQHCWLRRKMYQMCNNSYILR